MIFFITLGIIVGLASCELWRQYRDNVFHGGKQ